MIDALMQLPDSSRIWIYQADRVLNDIEVQELELKLNAFALQWTAHNKALVAIAKVMENRFALLVVDESRTGASGCSIDKSVHFMQALGSQYGIDWFKRTDFAYELGGKLEVVDQSKFSELYNKGEITGETLVYNNLATTLGAFKTQWRIPLAESWHFRLVS